MTTLAASHQTRDALGDRMKTYEQRQTPRRFDPHRPVYARIDGRAFSRFTKTMKRPYDDRLAAVMRETAVALIQKSDAALGYTQSDEISLVWNLTGEKQELFFGGRALKMASVLAAMASVEFMSRAQAVWPELVAEKLPHFDARVLQLPDLEEAANALYWRELDAEKNAVSMATRAHYRAKEMQNRSSAEMKAMLAAKGVVFDELPGWFRHGSFIRRRRVLVELTPAELAAIPERHRPTGPVERSRVEAVEIPAFRRMKNRAGFLFAGEDPIFNS